ncbi:MAG TPA: galactokinase [Acidimicrobiia bacterium]|nr:galactokinase [Acidimicrobiia bacterium]
MIITRTPLRITLGGGGTDVPSYYRKRDGGFLIAAAITKYVFIAVNRNFDGDYLLKYSQVERFDDPNDAEHRLLREILLVTEVPAGVEISSMADIPAGTGLGSSGAFTVGTLQALLAHRRDHPSNVELAQLACHVELERLGEPIGKQDQYIAAVGGITAFSFEPDESVRVQPLELGLETRERLEDNLLLFYTGIRRSASEVLALEAATDGGGRDTADLEANLDAVKALGLETAEALEHGDLDHFGALLSEQWQRKLERSPTPVHQRVDRWIRAGIEAGATGGKLVGAGDGGFLLFFSESKADLREAMRREGLDEVRFGIDYLGATVIVSG